jgi:signal transduction histidine kinase/phage shock protein PspC (stress-responsive transcriptional regulator)
MTASAARPPLVLPRDVVLGGVCAGVARHLSRSVTGTRLAFVGLAVLGGAGVVLYAWLWAFAPRDRNPAEPPGGRAVPVGLVLLIAAAVAALVVVVTWSASTVVPLGALEAGVLASAAVAWTLVADPRDPRHAPTASLVRALAATLLIVLGVALFPGTVIGGRPVVAVLCVVLVLLGSAAFLVPALLARSGVRNTERALVARQEQRAEIAAHLHDSVLQTLAIIQNRAGPGTEVARIARAQERELRDWLFAGTDPFADDLATELRTIARELELAHVVRIEVVTVGEVGEIESHALSAAAREAIANAARHAGGEVTVYAEATPRDVEVFVRDRGRGFDPAAVPAGRLGIRESIVGRMTRAGGSATVTSGEQGTEVHLRLPRPGAAAAKATT